MKLKQCFLNFLFVRYFTLFHFTSNYSIHLVYIHYYSFIYFTFIIINPFYFNFQHSFTFITLHFILQLYINFQHSFTLHSSLFIPFTSIFNIHLVYIHHYSSNLLQFSTTNFDRIGLRPILFNFISSNMTLMQLFNLL